MRASFVFTLERRGGAIANREVSVLSSAMNYALRRRWIVANPCYGVRRNVERTRHRYVTDEQLADALNRAPPALRDLLELAYLAGLRQKDLHELRKDQLREDGIHVEESKRGRRIVICWSFTGRQPCAR